MINSDCVMHGFGGYFECNLYKDTMISILPSTHSPGLRHFSRNYTRNMLNEGFLFKRGADDFRIFVLFSSPFIRDVLLVPDHVPHCKAAAAVQGREAERPLLEMCVQGWHSLSPCSN